MNQVGSNASQVELMKYDGLSVYYDGGEGGGKTDVIDGLSVDDIVTGTATSDSSMGQVEAKVKNVGNGAYRVAFMVAIFVFVVGLVIAGIQVFFSNAANRSEQKSNLIWKVIGVIVAMGAVAIIGFLATAALGIF